jgi:hypothetical protein
MPEQNHDAPSPSATGSEDSPSLEHMETTRGRGKGGNLELNFSDEPLAPDTPLIVFHHVRKTAGTSLRHIIRKNLVAGTHVYLDTPEGRPGLAAWHKDYYEGLSSAEKERLLYVGGHTAAYFIPVVDRPVRALSMVREPIDQLLSRYFFMREREWTLVDLCADAELRGDVSGFLNGQARSLLEPHFGVVEIPESADDPDAEEWRHRLLDLVGQQYTLGVQDRFAASLAMFGTVFGFEHQRPRRLRVNEDRPRDAQLDEEILGQLRGFTWLDEALYEHAVGAMDRYFEENQPRSETPRRRQNVARSGAGALSALEIDVDESTSSVVHHLEAMRAALADELDIIRGEIKEIAGRLKAVEHSQQRIRTDLERRDKRDAARAEKAKATAEAKEKAKNKKKKGAASDGDAAPDPAPREAKQSSNSSDDLAES